MLLYIETNFLMGIAVGRDILATGLLENTPASLRFVIPSICFVEAMATLEQEKKYNNEFLQRLNIQISQTERDRTSDNARLLLSLLRESSVKHRDRMNDIDSRFKLVFNQLISQAEMITLAPNIVSQSFNSTLLEEHIIDKFILECIVNHARLYPEDNKVFLSSNSREFAKPEVLDILRDAGVRYFAQTQNFLGWLQSQSI